MTKQSAKNAIILIGGYNLSTYATAFETQANVNPIDVTGFTDASKNFIPGLPSAVILSDMLWSSTANTVHTALHDFASSHVTILPLGYALGNHSISMPYVQANYGAKGDPTSAIQVGTLNFVSYGDNNGVEDGWVLAHGTITTTTTGTGFQVSSAQVTSKCAATLHIWTACAADTYVVKVQDCATVDGTYDDLITFSADGSAITSERQTLASGTINKFVRVLATRTGSAGNSFGFSVHFWEPI
ncbi:MAG: hypothetical protein WC657_03635 [Candidatus Paceibacterota bacterium]|jgi:hypothetical protein